MYEEYNTKEMFNSFSNMLAYPTSNFKDRVKACHNLLEGANPKAAGRLKKFLEFVEHTPAGRLEEIYASTFDLQPTCYPYAGFHLFGENFKRGAFMVKLQEQYKENGFAVENELPDHLGVIFKFLASISDEEQTKILVDECLIPVLQKMIKALGKSKTNSYEEVIQAILLVLQDRSKEMAKYHLKH